jgi:hypothetical protein
MYYYQYNKKERTTGERGKVFTEHITETNILNLSMKCDVWDEHLILCSVECLRH